MASEMKQVKVDKKDYFRALMTDTLPGDVPIIFSNDGLYINYHRSKKSPSWSAFDFFSGDLLKEDKFKTPFRYAIKKELVSLRKLSLLHPASQLKICKFYAQHTDAIIYWCSRSPASIRAPQKVGAAYYASDVDPTRKYKEVNIDTLETELFSRYSPSYFSYSGYNRFYKFFESPLYLELETKYREFMLLDIANCFESIYTHSISWAVKGKDFAKKNTAYKNQISEEFDVLMQTSNHGETKGIAVGAEIGRIFAEVIFQSIDVMAINRLKERYSLTYGEQYQFFRYVDDFLIFANSSLIAQQVWETLADSLAEFGLYLNDSKKKSYSRPFMTDRSVATVMLREELAELYKMLFEPGRLIPLEVSRPDSLKRRFIGRVKAICERMGCGYQGASSYVSSALCRRAILLANMDQDLAEDVSKRIDGCLVFLIDLAFFFYIVEPQVSSSYKIARTIIVVDRYMAKKESGNLARYRTMVIDRLLSLPAFQEDPRRAGYVGLEWLNILLATAEFGPHYAVSTDIVEHYISHKSRLSYFEIVSLLYYMKDKPQFDDKIELLGHEAIRRLRQKGSFSYDSELTHLFLDLISCPLLSEDSRVDLLDAYLRGVRRNFTMKPHEKVGLVRKLLKEYWFVNWDRLNIVKLLERKELQAAY